MDFGKDSYTTVSNVQTYLNRTLNANQQAILGWVIPAVSRWIDRTLGSNFDKLDNNAPASWTQRFYSGGQREISIHPCQNITLVQAMNPYNLTVWYTYTSPLEYTAEPYNLPVKRSLRLRLNEFAGDGLKWPSDANLESIAVTALFTEYDYVAGDYPSDIKTLANHISAVWLDQNKNTDVFTKKTIEGYQQQKNLNNLFDILESDPMVNRILQSRQEVWLEEM